MRIDFYHLQTSALERALPPLLERVLGAGHRAVVLAGSEERIEAFASLLWTYRPESWLPHGTRKDGLPAEHPVWLTDRDENPNDADVVVVTEGMVSARNDFQRCLDVFDGTSEEAVLAARGRWKHAKAGGHELHYWQQTETGWQERAL